MGTLFYGEMQRAISIDDRPLAHIQIVVLSKLRRGEGFGFSWSLGAVNGGGRSTVWLHPAIALCFSFDGGRQVTINRDWLEALTIAAASTSGLSLLPEPQAASFPRAGDAALARVDASPEPRELAWTSLTT